ncbi:hypothetical protein G6O69_18175 [Pseudenhygromyxa sp. WMMC2535]|uniref:hypothetical protein n=1 Tax=Pseudenhygromyxa sp. WMMC2535 TaxID=2712867 RepID=UPI00155458F0|nr:hypothetical protein [Pseudenhygromyxa sp. WMMC2535]NVB39777.1 hypothetical protein [Pseudenhygromyxa sp. WMMC2535]
MGPKTQPRRRGVCPALLLTFLAAACSEGEDLQDLRAIPETLARDPAADAEARLERFSGAQDWEGLVELLAVDHALARELLGPHRLRYTASYRSAPLGIEADPKSGALPPVPVGDPIYEAFSVDEQLELTWAAAPGEAPRFHLDQRTGPERGRELTVLDERAWSRVDHYGWYAMPLDGQLWQVWLDDAQHAALDLVALAGPAAEIDGVEALEIDGRPVLRVSLRPSEAHSERVVEAPTPWRGDADIELRSGELTLDRATGLWLAASFEIRWTQVVPGGSGGPRRIQGEVRFSGSVEPLAEAPSVEAPAAASPLPERERPELLRARLLDGLAGP